MTKKEFDIASLYMTLSGAIGQLHEFCKEAKRTGASLHHITVAQEHIYPLERLANELFHKLGELQEDERASGDIWER